MTRTAVVRGVADRAGSGSATTLEACADGSGAAISAEVAVGGAWGSGAEGAEPDAAAGIGCDCWAAGAGDEERMLNAAYVPPPSPANMSAPTPIHTALLLRGCGARASPTAPAKVGCETFAKFGWEGASCDCGSGGAANPSPGPALAGLDGPACGTPGCEAKPGCEPKPGCDPNPGCDPKPKPGNGLTLNAGCEPDGIGEITAVPFCIERSGSEMIAIVRASSPSGMDG